MFGLQPEQIYKQMYYNRSSNSPKFRFTYNNSYQSPARKDQCYNRPAQRNRTASLPPSKLISQSKPQNSSHIKIVEESFTSKRTRKHKIFQQQSPAVNRESASKQRRRSQSIFGQYKRNSRQKTIQRDSSTKKDQKQTVQVKKQENKPSQSAEKSKESNQSLQEMSISQLNNVIDRRIVQRISIIDSKIQATMRQQVGNNQILQKQQEIIYLKLQVQRLKRCENLNKQNQNLYRKLVSKIKEHTRKESSFTASPKKDKQIVTSDRKVLDKQTPIQSLCDLKRADQQIKQRTNGHSRQTLAKQSSSPKKQILSPQELFNANAQIQTKKSEIITNNSQTITFNNTKEIGKQRMHSKRLKMQTFPNMKQVKQQIIYSELNRQTFTQFPVESRLFQINNQLQKRITDRSNSKHKYETATSSHFYTPKPLAYSRQNTYNQMLYY